MATSAPSPKSARQASKRPIVPDPEVGSRTWVLIAAIAGMVGVAVLIVVLVQANKDDPPVSTVQQIQPVSVTGSTLPTYSGPDGSDAAVGLAAPTATGKNFVGTSQTLPSAGKPTMVVFAAHWCPHCQRELPIIVDWMRNGGNRGVDVVVVATGTNPDAPNYPPSAWLEDVNFRGRIIADDDRNTLGDAYGVHGYPGIVFVAADGTVKSRLGGEQAVAALDAGIASIVGSTT